VYPRVKLDAPFKLSISSIAAGVLAASIPLDITQVLDWATRFQTLFREYAIVGARMEIRVQNVSPAAGIVAAYIDEQAAAAPTATEAIHRPKLDMVAGPLTVPKSYHIDWTPRDILDLDFVSTATTFTPAWLKLYTDVGNFGANVAMTGQVIITGSLAFEFRGYV
jgi:hypothetical protein